MIRIAVFVGSLQKESLNKRLAKNIERVAPDEVAFDYIDIGSFPLFNQDLEADFPASVVAAKKIVDAADGVLFVTPEYNRSIPGVLKNAIDWTSRPWGSNSFAGKSAAIVGASVGPIGTAVAQSDLRHIAVYLDMKLLGQPEIYFGSAQHQFDEKGQLVELWEKSLVAHITAFVAWIEKETSKEAVFA